jgi:AraC family transcriptional regulator
MRYEDRHKEILFVAPEGLDARRHLLVSPFGLTGASIHEYRQETALTQETDPTPQADVLMAVLHLRDFESHRAWRDGKVGERSANLAGQFRVYDLREVHITEVPHAFHTVHFFLPHAAFSASGGGRAGASPTWSWDADGVLDDPVLSHVIQALVPALQSPDFQDALFCDHLLEAATRHISRKYSGLNSFNLDERGHLAPWQERRAKELLAARISGDVSISEVASACGLSADHFTRMFRRTTGSPPYRWLGQQRLERAKVLLSTSAASLTEIASACGFANQSHFTRAFSRTTGIGPGEWRRQAKL